MLTHDAKVLFAGILMFVCLPAAVKGQTASANRTTHDSTLADQKEVAVTVYNSNIALVRDVRRLELPKFSVFFPYAGRAGL